MKLSLILVLILIFPLHLMAQEFPIGKARKEIGDSIKESAIPFFVVVSQSDTCDVFNIAKIAQQSCYYKNNICYKVKWVYSLPSQAILNKSIKAMIYVLNDTYKKVDDNIWNDVTETVKIELTVINDKNQFVINVTPIESNIKN